MPTRTDAAAPDVPGPTPLLENGHRLEADQLERWAALLTDGQLVWPEALPPDQAKWLLDQVRRRRRRRLVGIIARLVAVQLAGEEPEQGQCNADNHV